jgi:hypothetical protein
MIAHERGVVKSVDKMCTAYSRWVTVSVCAGIVAPEDTLKQVWAWHPKQGGRHTENQKSTISNPPFFGYSHSMVAGGLLEMS